MVEVINMVWRQMTVDIFLIDWERPRATKDNNQPVSIWRTYFVANEWNEIQSHRRTSLTIQLICTVLLIKVLYQMSVYNQCVMCLFKIDINSILACKGFKDAFNNNNVSTKLQQRLKLVFSWKDKHNKG